MCGDKLTTRKRKANIMDDELGQTEIAALIRIVADEKSYRVDSLSRCKPMDMSEWANVQRSNIRLCRRLLRKLNALIKDTTNDRTNTDHHTDARIHP